MRRQFRRLVGRLMARAELNWDDIDGGERISPRHFCEKYRDAAGGAQACVSGTWDILGSFASLSNPEANPFASCVGRRELSGAFMCRELDWGRFGNINLALCY